VLGSPRYMAPEQLRRRAPRSPHRPLRRRRGAVRDGRRRLAVRRCVADRRRARDHPRPARAAARGDSPRSAARVRQALEKDPARRPPPPARSRRRCAPTTARPGWASPRGADPRPPTRLIVVPFRLLRPDPEIDFLPYSLADAVASSLAGLDTLVVRSSLGAVQPTGTLDLGPSRRRPTSTSPSSARCCGWGRRCGSRRSSSRCRTDRSCGRTRCRRPSKTSSSCRTC
jgi:hypothetical protein